MNFNICKYKCNRSWFAHPEEIIHYKEEDEWFLKMIKYGNGDSCGFQRIKPAKKLFETVNKYDVWIADNDNIESIHLLGYNLDLDWFLSQIELYPGECECPFTVEHCMFDISHADRKRKWMDYLKSRYEDMQKRIERN